MTTLREAAQQALEALHVVLKDDYRLPYEKIVAATDALNVALAEPDTCTWFQDGDSESGVYATSCRGYFDITDGTPEDNKMQWCCYCGKKLAQELIKEDEDE